MKASHKKDSKLLLFTSKFMVKQKTSNYEINLKLCTNWFPSTITTYGSHKVKIDHGFLSLPAKFPIKRK